MNEELLYLKSKKKALTGLKLCHNFISYFI